MVSSTHFHISASPPTFKLLIIIKKSHAILLSRLSKFFGINGSVLQWFHSYPSDCTQYVKVNGASSDHHFLQLGVPQGTPKIQKSKNSQKKKNKWLDKSCFKLKTEELHFGKLTSKFPSDPILRGTFFVIKTAFKK